MASIRILEGVCRACRTTLARLQRSSAPLSFSQKRLAGTSALPPADEVPEEDLTEFEISTEDFKFVEQILPKKTVPSIPEHENYPTPSGWIPPKESAKSLPYFVNRTKNHMLPIYEDLRNGNTRKLVMIKRIEGDIWKFDEDLRKHLLEITGRRVIASQVNELAGSIRIKGWFANEVCQYLLDKGF